MESERDVCVLVGDVGEQLQVGRYGEQPDLVIAWLERGNAHAAMGQKQLAAEDYSEAIRRKADFPLAYNNRGLLFLQAGDAIAALQDFDRALQL